MSDTFLNYTVFKLHIFKFGLFMIIYINILDLIIV